ncbi:metallophosphoesterase [Ostreiculturibacter nitratireducens]|uniref:metallophosphoesterase n=1 Tax=Ostreiculturibacter nitratireducens TaxID=3075226 RepID=UPI0031B5A9C7
MKSLVLASLAVLSLGAGAANADYSLTILHTNDFHSQFGPIDFFDRDCPADENDAGKCFGGSARLATAIAEARARSDNTVLLDAGDQFPSLNDPSNARPKLLAELMNRMGYDAMALGSHEFDEGPQITRTFLDRLEFPALMANADLSEAPLLVGAVQKSTVIERGGERLGIIGLTPEGSTYWRDVDYITISDSVTAVQTEVDKLTADGVDKIIVLSHSGYEADKRIARETTGIDVIVGGHTHTYLSNTLKPSQGPYPTTENGVPIVHAWPFGNTLGELQVSFDDRGNLVSAVGDQIRLDAEVAEDTSIKALVSDALLKSE